MLSFASVTSKVHRINWGVIGDFSSVSKNKMLYGVYLCCRSEEVGGLATVRLLVFFPNFNSF